MALIKECVCMKNKTYTVRIEFGDGEYWYGNTKNLPVRIDFNLLTMEQIVASGGVVFCTLDALGDVPRIDGGFRVTATPVTRGDR